MKREGEDSSTSGVVDEATESPLNWAELFFSLHRYCNLNKWEIWEYTLPQITELMKCINRYIRFEVETRMGSLGMFGGSSSTEEEYKEATEEDIMELSKVLGG